MQQKVVEKRLAHQMVLQRVAGTMWVLPKEMQKVVQRVWVHWMEHLRVAEKLLAHWMELLRGWRK